VRAVIALDGQVFDGFGRANFDFGGGYARLGRELHGEGFVENDAGETFDRRLENVRARCAAQGKRHVVPFDAHGDFVLRTSERKADSFFSREQRALGKFLKMSASCFCEIVR